MMPARFAPRKSIVFAVMTSVAALMAPTLAHADIASDLRNDPSMVLWLDPLDPSGTDLDGTAGVPFPGYVNINTWRDKSLHGNHATSPSGAKYSGSNGMVFDGATPYTLPSKIYGETPSDTMEAFVFARALNSPPTYYSPGAVLNFQNGQGGTVVLNAGNHSYGQSEHMLRHQSNQSTQGTSVGYVTRSYQTSAQVLGTATATEPNMGVLVSYRVNGAASSMSIQQELVNVATLTGAVPVFAKSLIRN